MDNSYILVICVFAPGIGKGAVGWRRLDGGVEYLDVAVTATGADEPDLIRSF